MYTRLCPVYNVSCNETVCGEIHKIRLETYQMSKATSSVIAVLWYVLHLNDC